MELNPAAPWSHAGLGLCLFLLQGKFEEAASAAHDDAAEWARLYITAMARWSQKRIPEADAALADLIQNYADVAAYQIAASLRLSRREGSRIRMVGARTPATRCRPGRLIRSDPFYANLHGDPRWDAFLRTMGLADDQLK